MNARAGFVTRSAAFATDLAILATVGYGIAAFGFLLRDALPRMGPRIHVGAIYLALSPLLFACYRALFWIARGATPGQWLFGVRVVNIQGGRIRPRQALVRVIGYVVSALPFYAGFLWVLGPKRRAWHDLLSRTAVIYTPRPLRP